MPYRIPNTHSTEEVRRAFTQLFSILDSVVISESDPVFSASVAAEITQEDVDSWNLATESAIQYDADLVCATTVDGGGTSEETDPLFTAWQASYDHSANWDSAYGWGNHASAGYLTSETSHSDVVVDGDFSSQGLIKRGASSGSYSIVTDNSANWDLAYGWGDHSVAGYLTSGTASVNLKPSNPTGTTSSGGVMMGLGSTIHFAPTSSGIIRFTIDGVAYANGAGSTITVTVKYGTGTAPINGAVPAGTTIGVASQFAVSGTAGDNRLWSKNIILTGLSTSTTYWFDVMITRAGTSNTVSISGVNATLEELCQ